MASVDHQSAADIEREIAEERTALARTLDEIHDRLSFEALSNGLVGRVRDGGGDIGRTVARTARDNPIPFALTAIGLAWLLAGHRYSRSGEPEGDPYARAASMPASARWSEETRRDRDFSVDPAPVYEGVRTQGRWDNARGGHSGARDAVSAADDTSRSVRDSLSAGAHAVGDGLRAGLAAVGETAHAGAAGAARYVSGTNDAVRRGAKSTYASAAELRQRIAEGTDDLSASARKRVIAARTRAYEAQLRAEQYAGRSRERATDFFEEQPLVAGALALAVGAAIGGLLPRTRQEDVALGSYRDQVFEEAERIYRDERDRIESVVRETASEARHVAKDLAHDVKGEVERGVQRTSDIARAKFAETEAKARDAAERVTDKVSREADKVNREAEKQGH